METLKQWTVFCETENKIIEVWKFSKPECCPTNTRHVINTESVQEIGQMQVESDKKIQIYSKSFEGTNGYYEIEGVNVELPTGSNVVTYDHTFPVGVCIYGLSFDTNENQFGDNFDMVINPHITIGVLMSGADAGATQIHVNDTVTNNIVKGFELCVSGHDGTLHNMGRVLDFDKLTDIVTIEHAAETPLLPYCHVCLYVHMVKKYYIRNPCKHDIGYGGFGGKYFQAGTVVRLIYRNVNPTTPKYFSFNFEYTY